MIRYGDVVQANEEISFSDSISPCPRCKSRDIKIVSNGRLTKVKCENCNFQSPSLDGHYENAIIAWHGLSTN